jgi:hypothetical protein
LSATSLAEGATKDRVGVGSAVTGGAEVAGYVENPVGEYGKQHNGGYGAQSRRSEEDMGNGLTDKQEYLVG